MQPAKASTSTTIQRLDNPAAAHPWRLVISVAVMLHLLAVVAEPMRFFSRSSRGTSPLADPVRWSLGPYVEFAYLNHGYFFFAPEPGPSHLLECRLKFGDEEGMLRFPDRKAQRPRLLYHRHFMLAEFLNQLHMVPVQPEIAGDDQQLLADWQADRQRYEMIRDSMTRHLRARYQADSATIDRIEHRLPSSIEVLEEGLPLDDARFYLTLPDAPALVPPDPSNAAAIGIPTPATPEAAEVIAPNKRDAHEPGGAVDSPATTPNPSEATSPDSADENGIIILNGSSTSERGQP